MGRGVSIHAQMSTEGRPREDTTGKTAIHKPERPQQKPALQTLVSDLLRPRLPKFLLFQPSDPWYSATAAPANKSTPSPISFHIRPHTTDCFSKKQGPVTSRTATGVHCAKQVQRSKLKHQTQGLMGVFTCRINQSIRRQ